MMKSFYALLEQELLLIEGEGRYILVESVRDKLGKQGAKTGRNAGDNQDLPTKHQPSTNQAPTKHQPSTNQAPYKSSKHYKKQERNDAK